MSKNQSSRDHDMAEIEALFDTSAPKPPTPTSVTIKEITPEAVLASLNAEDVFPAPSSHYQGVLHVLGASELVLDEHVYWNVFDVQGVLTSSVVALVNVIRDKVPVDVGRWADLIAITTPVVWRDERRRQFAGPSTRFVAFYRAPEYVELDVISHKTWPGEPKKPLRILPRVSRQEKSGGKVRWVCDIAPPDGAPFELYRVTKHPTLQPHYALQRIRNLTEVSYV